MDAPFSKNNTLLCIVFGKLNHDAQLNWKVSGWCEKDPKTG